METRRRKSLFEHKFLKLLTTFRSPSGVSKSLGTVWKEGASSLRLGLRLGSGSGSGSGSGLDLDLDLGLGSDLTAVVVAAVMEEGSTVKTRRSRLREDMLQCEI